MATTRDQKRVRSETERPTLKTIARLSGLAVPTVSRALSDAPDIGQQTKERVQQIAQEIGYRRDRAAVRLRTGKTNVLALVLGANSDVMNHTARLISSIDKELRGTPYHMIITPYFDDESPIDPVKYIVETGSADGVIINRIQPEDPRIEYLRENNFPYVTHGRSSTCERDPYFDFDNEKFSRFGVRALVERGRKRILLIAPNVDQSYAIHTIKGAMEEAQFLGAHVSVLKGASSDSDANEIHAAVLAAFERDDDIDGIIVSAPPAAVAATLAAEKLGHSIGETIDIVSKEAIPYLEAFRDKMLIVHEDVDEAGCFIARALMQAIDHPEEAPMQHVAVPDPIERRHKN